MSWRGLALRPAIAQVAPDAELTPETLASMTDEQFAKLFNEMQASGNKDKLRQLFGA
jgi:hypothetical protein